MWLYGSQASGEAHPESDFDLAIAFEKFIKDPLERALRPERLAMEWTSQFKLPEKKLLSEKLDNKDYFAVERLLQVLIESEIGIAKQLYKQAQVFCDAMLKHFS